MLVLILTAVPPGLRGHVSRWLVEISPGVFIGSVSHRVRELLWEQTIANVKDGRAIMAFPAPTEQGYDFRVHGHHWTPVDFDGLQLIMRPNSSQKRERAAQRSGWSRASQLRKYGNRPL